MKNKMILLPTDDPDMNKVIYTMGYGLMKGSHQERAVAFRKRLEYICRGIGKAIAIVDIRMAGSGSRNGKLFAQGNGMAALVVKIQSADITYTAEPVLANPYGSSKQELNRYENRIAYGVFGKSSPFMLYLDPELGFLIKEAADRIIVRAKKGEQAILLLCGCKQAFKGNATTPNCHRVIVANELIELLGEGWNIVHL